MGEVTKVAWWPCGDGWVRFIPLLLLSGAIKMEPHSSAAAFCSLLLAVCFPGLLCWRSCHNKTVQRVWLHVDGGDGEPSVGRLRPSPGVRSANAILFIAPYFACDFEGGGCLHHLKYNFKRCCSKHK